LLLILQLTLVWAYPRYATQDGPSHLYNAAIIAGFHSPLWSGVSRFYRLNSQPIPNLLTYVMLEHLMKAFSAVVAEKILVTAYFVLFAFSFWWIVRVIHRDAEHFLAWGLVLGSNLFVRMGFYNFCYGLSLFLICLAYWLRNPRRFGPTQWLVLTLLSGILYFTHLFCFLMAQFAIGAVSAVSSLKERWRVEPRSEVFSSRKSRTLMPVIFPQFAFLPYFVLFLFQNIGSRLRVLHPDARSLWERIFIVRELYVLVESRDLLAAATVAVIGLFLGLASYRVLSHPRMLNPPLFYGLAAFSVVCLTLFVALPNSFHEVPERAGWFGLCIGLLCLASYEWGVRGKAFIYGFSVMVCIMGIADEARWCRDVSALLSSYDDAARHIEPNRSILSLCYCDPKANQTYLLTRLRWSPLEHAGEVTALAARDFSLSNYEATGSIFPVEYLPEVNPDLQSTTLDDYSIAPQTADLSAYESKAGRTIDYVLLWGGPQADARQTAESTLDQQLRSGYSLAYTSQPPSLLRLFERRKTSIASTGRAY
jgi:hypothetical protein